MTPEEYEHIQNLFLQLRHEPLDIQQKGLQSQPNDVREQVLSLISAEQECGDFLNHPSKLPEGLLVPDGATEPHSWSPTTRKIGPYRILQQIGEGGHGTVHLAEQMEPMSRKVAIKLIKPGMDSKQVLVRFQAERQALAMMNHPSIARVFDGGSTETGLPYFVMELVQGVPINEFCDTHRLDLNERLTLFLQVCHAVHHAHQKGIIHRDLKPSNVLVTMEGTEPLAKVIDFGIAKALDTKLTPNTVVTEYGQMVGTLQYMSPEQAELSAVDIDTRSDVYSLGVLLYQLLTGTTPISRETIIQQGLFEVPRLIRETEATTPSSKVKGQRRLGTTSIGDSKNAELTGAARGFRGMDILPKGDLDWITMKAISKDRRRRYDSAVDFARDLQRFLDGAPVEAHPPSWTYKAQKHIRKHWAVALSSLLVFLSLALGLAGLTAGLYEAKASQNKAQAAKRELASAMYSELLSTAWDSTQEQSYERANALLDQCEPELRRWEWQFVQSQTQDRARAHAVLRSKGDSLVRGLDYNANTNSVSCVLENGGIEIRKASPGHLFKRIEANANVARFNHVGDRLVVGTKLGETCTYAIDANNHVKLIRRRRLGLGGIYDLCIAGNLAAVCTGGGWAEVFDTETLKTVQSWKTPTRLSSLFISKEKQVVATGLDGNAYILEIGADKISQERLSQVGLHSIQPQKMLPTIVLSAGRVLSWNDDTNTTEEILRCQGATSDIAINRCGTIAIGCRDGRLYAGGMAGFSFVAKFSHAISALSPTQEPSEFVVALSDGRMLRVDLSNKRSGWSLELPTRQGRVHLLSQTKQMLVLNGKGAVLGYDLETGEQLFAKQISDKPIWSLATDTAEQLVATVGEDSMLRCWSMPNWELKFERNIDWGVREVCLSPCGSWLATAPPAESLPGQREGSIGIWDTKTGSCLRLLNRHRNWVLALAATADGKRLVSSGENRKVHVWDIKTGEMLKGFSSDRSAAEIIRIGRDGNTLFLGHRDGWITTQSLQHNLPVKSSSEQPSSEQFSLEQPRQAWSVFGDAITGMHVTQDNRILSTSRSSPQLRVLDAAMGARPVAELDIGLDYLRDFVMTGDERFVCFVDRNDVVWVSSLGK